MTKEFLKNKLLTAFATSYGKKLRLNKSNYSPLNDLILIINILSGEYGDLLEKYIIVNPKLKNLIGVLNKRDKQLIATNFKDNHTTIFNKMILNYKMLF